MNCDIPYCSYYGISRYLLHYIMVEISASSRPCNHFHDMSGPCGHVHGIGMALWTCPRHQYGPVNMSTPSVWPCEHVHDISMAL